MAKGSELDLPPRPGETLSNYKARIFRRLDGRNPRPTANADVGRPDPASDTSCCLSPVRASDRYDVRASARCHPSQSDQSCIMRHLPASDEAGIYSCTQTQRFVTFHVCQLHFDRLRVKTLGIEDRRSQHSEAVTGHFILVAHPLKSAATTVLLLIVAFFRPRNSLSWSNARSCVRSSITCVRSGTNVLASALRSYYQQWAKFTLGKIELLPTRTDELARTHKGSA